jgi:hypothetical protein
LRHAHDIANARDPASTALHAAPTCIANMNGRQCAPPHRATSKECKGGSTPRLASQKDGCLSEPPEQ